MPERIQLRRTKGWRLPPHTKSVARPTRWGNPYVVGDFVERRWMGQMSGACVGCYDGNDPRSYDTLVSEAPLDAAEAVALYRQGLVDMLVVDPSEDRYWHERAEQMKADLELLRGWNLACWCPLDQPCHADVLLELANPESVHGPA